MNSFKLKLTTRNKKATTNSLRTKGLIPGILYGVGINNTSVQVDYKEFVKAYRQAGGSSLLEIEINDKEKSFVFIQEHQRNPVSGNIIHIDFYKPNLEKTVIKNVPLVFIGESSAVKNEGGILVKSIHEIEIEARPQDMPHELQVDISKLAAFDDVFRVGDLPALENVEILTDKEEAIAIVEPPRSEEELQSLEETPTESIESVEGIKEEAPLIEEKQE